MVRRLEFELMDDVLFCYWLLYVEWYAVSDRSLYCLFPFLLFFQSTFPYEQWLSGGWWYPISTVTGLGCFWYCLDFYFWLGCVICLDYFHARLTFCGAKCIFISKFLIFMVIGSRNSLCSLLLGDRSVSLFSIIS